MDPVRPESSAAPCAALALHIRQTVLDMAYRSKTGHLGSAFSAVDLLACLYAGFLRIDPTYPGDPDRDRFILSKGHACSALYAALAERGFFPQDLLVGYMEDGSSLGGHPSMNIPGVDAATGSLGHGLGIGAGMALAALLDAKSYRTVVLLSDGECNEGSVWESALFAAHHQLSNLIAIVDCNGIQGFGRTEDVLGLEPFAEKWRAFGWAVQECDGHDHMRILKALERSTRGSGVPQLILARTIKGKGVSYMENTVDWHYWSLTNEQYREACAELSSVS